MVLAGTTTGTEKSETSWFCPWSGCRKSERARTFHSQISVNLLAWIFPMIKTGDLETGDRRGWEGQGRGGGLHAASLLGQTQHSTARLRAFPSFPCTPSSWWQNWNIVIRTLECLWSPQPFSQAYLIHPRGCFCPRASLHRRAAVFASWASAAHRVLKLLGLLSTMLSLNKTAFYFFWVSFQYWQLGRGETKSKWFQRPCFLTERFQMMLLINLAAGF